MQIRTRKVVGLLAKSSHISMLAKERTPLVRAVAPNKHGIMFPDFIWTRLWVVPIEKESRRNLKRSLKSGNSVELKVFLTMTQNMQVQLIDLKSREKSLRR